MQLTWSGVRFEFWCQKSEKDYAKNAGFHFDWNKNCWWTGRQDLARKLDRYADSKAQGRLKQTELVIEASRALDSKLHIPAPEGLEYLPFQKGGIAYALPRYATLIADEMGLGKTVECCGIINADPKLSGPGRKKMLFVTPASLKLNWGRELTKWLVRRFEGGYIEGGVLPDTELVIGSYDIMYDLRHELREIVWDAVFLDEAHYIKNPDSQRTRAIAGIDAWDKELLPPITTKRWVFTTGTPILNRPKELWPMLKLGAKSGLGSSEWAFLDRYCSPWDSPWGTVEYQPKNLEELQVRLRNELMVRRLKKDVLKDLPPKRRQIVAIQGAPEFVELENRFYAANRQTIDNQIEARLDEMIDIKDEAEELQLLGTDLSYRGVIKQLERTDKTTFDKLSLIRHATAVAKIPYVIRYLEEVLEQQPKVVVFAHHRDVINAIYEKFKNIAVKVDGSVPVNKRQGMVDKFQDDKKIQLFVGGFKAAGVGYTLTAASYCLFAELDWVPATITQAEDRLHRIGQIWSVLIQHLVFDKSIDVNMGQKIIQKQEMMDKALDTPTQRELFPRQQELYIV